MDYNLTKFKEGLKVLKIELDQSQFNQFIKYYEMIVKKNEVMNLTTITDFDEVVNKHFLDSISIVKFVDFKRKIRILDLGTGAGFPGIPLKIVFPDIDFVLMDSLNKKILFLEEVIGVLNLKQISAVHGRAEEMAQKKEYRENFDVCVSRAVANLASLCEFCLPFVKLNEDFISYKSGEIDDELEQAKRAIYLLGGKVNDVVKFQVPGTDINRSLIKISKVKKTPRGYPRKAGTPGREPIK